MPRSEQANQELREEAKKRILDAARHVYARKGSNATISDIATEAGVSQGLAYRYFPSKEAIFLSLLKQMTRSSEELELIVQNIPGTAGERLHRIVSSMVERRGTDPEFYQFYSQAMANDTLPPEVRKRMNAQGLHIHEILRRLIVEGQATGEIAKDDPDELLQAITACLDGLTRMAPPSLKRSGDHIPNARIFLRMLRPDRSRE
ncbi:MAG: TetR/AcrR family transcriptional regulator [Nitrososphaerota archaeon]|nr:TetR/AcrR family transcriptional regulator [Nitrososphaerota archaeon]